MSKEEFFSLTPVLFRALRKEWLESRREEATLNALLRREIINFSMSRPKEPVTLEDLLPGVGSEHPKQRRMSQKQRQKIAEQIRQRMRAIPGLIVKEAG